MHARVTHFDITVGEDAFAEAQRTFERLVAPELRRQSGYEGCYLMRTQRGRGLLVTLWESDDPMRASDTARFYADQLEKLEPLLGRHASTESYRIDYADHRTG